MSATSTHTMKHLFMAFVLFAFSVLAKAQDASFTASVDKNVVAMGEQFEISFALSGGTSGRNFRAPAFNDFIVLSGPNSSTNVQMGTGGTFATATYSYILQPRAEGKFTIGSAMIEFGGRQLQTKPVTIQVTKGAPQTKQQSGQAGDSDVGKQIGDNLFLKASVDKPRAYQGEQLTVTYKIYTRVNIVNYGITKAPAMTGFWAEDIDVQKQQQAATEIINGKQYRVAVLKKTAVFPQRSGTLELDPMEVECVVQMQTRRRSNDLFDQFFSDPFFGNVTNVNHKIRSEPVKISIVPLPVENVPPGFTGAVGKYSMNAWLDKPQTKTGEAVTLKVKIEGRGNLKLLEAPSVVIPPDLEKYDPKISDNVSNQSTTIAGSRSFEYVLIPRHPGEQKIPSFPFTYFDPEKKSYVLLKSPEFTLSVERGSEIASAPVSGISKEDVKLLGEDIRFIKSDDVSFRRKGERLLGSPMFYAMSISPVVAFIGFVVYMRRREKVLGNISTLKNRRARKMAQRRLAEASKFMRSKRKVEFYDEISRALWGYVSDKLGIPPSDLSVDAIRSSLESRGVSAEIVAKLSSTLEQCEFARFAPSSDSLQLDAVYNEAVTLISTIEDQIR